MEQKTKNVIICLIVVGIIVFIGAMLGTSLRKLSTEEGKFLYTVLQNNAWKIVSAESFKTRVETWHAKFRKFFSEHLSQHKTTSYHAISTTKLLTQID